MTLKDSALVLIEYQNEWLDPTGKLRFLLKDMPQFDNAVAQSKVALHAARASGLKVIHMGLHLYPDHREMGGLGATQFGMRGAIPRVGTWRTNESGHLHPEPFVPRDDEFVGTGRTGGSVFAGTNLDIFMRNQNIKKVYIMGFALHVRILSSLCQGHDLVYEMKVLEDCCAAFTPDQRHSVLTDIVHHFGERVTNEQFLSRLNAG
jgi:biuret amidohydrolase